MFKRVYCAIVDCASWNRVFMVNHKFYAKKKMFWFVKSCLGGPRKGDEKLLLRETERVMNHSGDCDDEQ